jgi:hypothetical protein
MRLNRREFMVGGVVGAALGNEHLRTGAKASAVSLEVLISGLCGVVHRRNLHQSDVILLNAAGHLPRLYTDLNVISSGLSHSGIDGTRKYWDLTRRKLRFEAGAGTSELTGQPPGPGQQRPPNAAGRNDVGWLAQMPRVPGAGPGRIAPVNLRENPQPPKVAAKVRFTGGEFAARFRSPYDQIVWKIGAGTPPFNRAIGEPVISQNVNSPVTIVVEEYGSTAKNQIVLATAGGSGTLVVEISNMPSSYECNNADVNTLAHFAAYYELLLNPPAPPNRPVPETSQKRDCSDKMVEPVYCPAAEYNE